MQEEPELETRVGHRQIDLVSMREIHGLRKIWVLVNVMDAPNFIVRPPASTTRFALTGLLGIDRPLNELQWSAPKPVYLHRDTTPMTSMPMHDVLLFRHEPFRKHQKFAAERSLGRGSVEWSASRLPMSHRVHQT